jgi:GNAT superfamily N-acetyltransferase
MRQAVSSTDFDAFGDVCRAHVNWSRQRYREMPWFVEQLFGHQALDDELKELAAKYSPPNGRTVLVDRDGEVIGGCAYVHLSGDICELKRLYLDDRARGTGIGRALLVSMIEDARGDGYRSMRLDTGKLLPEAIALYQSAGFAEIDAYHDYPATLLPHILFMERQL